MNTVERSKSWNLQPLRKKQSSYKKRKLFSYFTSMLFASLLGTYLDLFFVGKKLYEFPVRPLPDIFTINIAFTLLGIPILTCIFLFLAERIGRWKRWLLMVGASAIIPTAERLSEQGGFFVHTGEWNHGYSFFGYFLFLIVIWRFYTWANSLGRQM